MTVPVDRPPAAVEQKRPATEAPDPPDRKTTAEKLGIEDHQVLPLVIMAAVVVLAFTAMIVLTALGGGTDYVPWVD
jgi:hypothetical protein